MAAVSEQLRKAQTQRGANALQRGDCHAATTCLQPRQGRPADCCRVSRQRLDVAQQLRYKPSVAARQS